MAGQLWTLPAAAHAPPQVTGIFAGQAPDGVPREWIRTNRGVILQNGASEPLRLLCNDAYQASLSEVPPMIASPDGLIVASYAGGLIRVTPDGCNAQPLEAPLADRHLADLATTADPARYLALVSPSLTEAGAVLVSPDVGHTWKVAADIPAFGTAMLSAPSDADRVYISAVAETADGSPSNQLFVSRDGAKTFTPHPLKLADSEVRAYLLAVDPLDADRLFMRPLGGDPEAPERLLLSENAGDTFSEVYSAVGPLVFAIDSETAWLGGKEGLYRSDDRGKTFAPVAGAPGYIGCLRPGAHGLLVCGYQDNEFGIFQADSEQTSFSPYLRVGDVNSQVACGADVVGLCQANFDDWVSDLAPVESGGARSDDDPAAGAPNGTSNAGGASTAPSQEAHGASGCSFRARPASGSLAFAVLLGLAYSFGRLRRLPTEKRRTPPGGASAPSR